MKSRREFIKDIGIGALSFTSASAVGSYAMSNTQTEQKKRIRIGIIGAIMHTPELGKMFNIDKKYPGVEVLYVWGETDKNAKTASEKGAIPNIVKDPLSMMGKIDALIVTHQHPKYHLEAALPFVKAGIPTFIDKPFCYRVAEGKEFLKIAREKHTPVTSYSGLAQTYGVLDMKEQVSKMDDILHIICYGPVGVTSPFGGVFFYGVHTIEPLMNIFGQDVAEVKITKKGINITAGLAFESGRFATVMLIERSTRLYKWETFVLHRDKGLIKLESRIDEGKESSKPYDDMVEMFRTGKEPRSYDDILKCVGVLEALEKSVETQEWEKVVV